jgi:hypothetical protein
MKINMSLIKDKIKHVDYKQLKLLFERMLQNVIAIPSLQDKQRLNVTEEFSQIEVLLKRYQQYFDSNLHIKEDFNDVEIEDRMSQIMQNVKDICFQHQQDQLYAQCNEWFLTLHLWRISNHKMIHILEPVVNSIAEVSNVLREPKDLSIMTECIKKILTGVSNEYKDDMLNHDPKRPWRLLLFNYGIVATRSHESSLIEHAFEYFVHHLPEDAALFFTEAMEQMTALNYPQQVRVIVEKYYKYYAINADYKKHVH